MQTSGIRTFTISIAIRSVQDEVAGSVLRICDWLASHAIAPAIRSEVELVLAEALNNVVEHGYLYSPDGAIEIAVSLSDVQLTTTIVDSGRKFDHLPEGQAANPEDLALADLPEGGFGWALIRTLTENVTLERVGDRNRLTLVHRIEDRQHVPG